MTDQIKGTREDTFRVTLTIDGEDWGVWDQKTGGKIAANSITYKPGSMGQPYGLGGSPSTEVITLERNYRLQRDHDRYQALKARVGRGRCTVKVLPLDTDKNAYGSPDVEVGVLESVTPPTHNSGSTNAAMVVLEITPDGPAA